MERRSSVIAIETKPQTKKTRKALARKSAKKSREQYERSQSDEYTIPTLDLSNSPAHSSSKKEFLTSSASNTPNSKPGCM